MEMFERNKIYVPKPEILENKPFEKKNENFSEKKYENFSQKKQEDFSQKKIEDFSWKKKQENLSTFSKKSRGNFRHFNQIAEIIDQKASNLPYFSDFEQKKASFFPQNLSEKFETEKSQENLKITEENQDFSKIWFNPKSNLNKFSEKTQTKSTENSLKIPEKKPVEKINLNSILKTSKHKNQSKIIENDSFSPIKLTVKTRLYQWLISINLLKENLKNNLIEKLPKICRNGVIFADIINRLESRDKSDILKGITRKPKKQAEIHANFTRVFDYFSKFEKMNKRFLYSYDPFFEGNEDIFWSFLDDIWHIFHAKLSNSDSRFQELQHSKRVSLNETWNKRFFNSSKKSELSNASYDEICQENNIKSRKKTTENSRFESLKPSNHEENTKKYEVQAWTLPPKLEEPPVKEKNKPLLPETLKQEVLSWLKEVGYGTYLSKIGSKNIWEDPTRNGLLLGLLLNRLHYTKLILSKEPKSLCECMKNLDLAFQAIRKLQLSLPYEFLWKINEILLGNEVVIYQVFLCLKRSMDKNPSYSTRLSTRNSKSLTLRTSSPLHRSFSRTDSARLLIKNKDEIEDAEKKLFEWLKDSGFLTGLSVKNPQDFNEIFPFLTNGVIFCDLAERLCGVSLVGVNRKPLNEKLRLSNVAKAMEFLKEKGFINLQCWTMSLKEIPEGNYLFILDVLELLYGLTNKNSFVKKDYSTKKSHKKEEMASLELCESNREVFKENMEKNREKSIVSQKEEVRNADLLINSGILKNKLGKKLENTGVLQVKSIKFNEDFGKSKEKNN